MQSYSWSEERQQEYMNTHSREVDFQEDGFLRVIEGLSIREELHNEMPEFKDYFHR